MENNDVNNNLKTAPFEQISDPFAATSQVVKAKINSLSGNQMEAMDFFVKELGKDAAQVLEGLTPDKISFLLAILTERQQNRLAIARWNWFAKSIKYSFISLCSTMLVGYGIGWLVQDTPYSPFIVLSEYLGEGWMEAWFVAMLFGSAHNVYDSIVIQRGVKKVREFSEKWTRKMLKKKKEK